MNKLILSTLLFLAPCTTLPMKKYQTKQPIKRHIKRTLTREIRSARRAICNPRTLGVTITVGGTVFVATLQTITAILTLFLK